MPLNQDFHLTQQEFCPLFGLHPFLIKKKKSALLHAVCGLFCSQFYFRRGPQKLIWIFFVVFLGCIDSLPETQLVNALSVSRLPLHSQLAGSLYGSSEKVSPMDWNACGQRWWSLDSAFQSCPLLFFTEGREDPSLSARDPNTKPHSPRFQGPMVFPFFFFHIVMFCK